MANTCSESYYDLKFRSSDAKTLGEHIRLRHSVELIGMKRVGISNFLRFFLYQQNITDTYINHGEKHLFIPVDLNDLVQNKIFSFWILAFKRLVDAVETAPNPGELKHKISDLFLSSIQSQNLFLTLENMKKAIALVVDLEIYPTFFLIRFDRLAESVTEEFFANLQGMIDASGQKLNYVFTSFRSLDQISPQVFTRQSLLAFSHLMHIKPASTKDMKIIFETFQSKYQLPLSDKELNQLVKLSGGHVQYLQLSLIILYEKLKEADKNVLENIETHIYHDERINLQSEEIWTSLTKEEQTVLKKILAKEVVTEEDKQLGKYLWETGIVEDGSSLTIFSPLFEYYLNQHHHPIIEVSNHSEFTKKESRLFEMLKTNIDQVCERDSIISIVWAEYEEFGVSNWTVDRLVARLREKMKKQQSPYQIVTVKTRGYKLINGQ